MKRRIIAVIMLCAMLISLLCGCEINIKNTGSRTLFIYMCGSNLETKQGLAGKNIDELLSAEISDDVNIVIETGGTKTWRSHGIDSGAIQRYEVKNGELKLLETLDNANMGEAQTLTEFLVWGQENYPSAHNMLVLWDHGGGAAKGVCFDENYGFEPLSLLELKSALENANLKNKFDIIGFDACLMASIETAAMVQDFADYMIASEEIEPSGGWDYKTLTESYAGIDDPLEVGKAVCDSYIEKCREKGKDIYSTLSVFDLSQTDSMLEQMGFVIKSLIADEIGSENASTVLSAMNNCEKFGGDNAYQGTANMLDLLDFVSKVIDNQSTNAVDVFIAGSCLVPYKVSDGRNNAHGVSFYYPMIYNENEIRNYVALGFNEQYNEFLSRLYMNVPEKTIAFTDPGSISDNGAFTVKLTPGSMNYLNHIDFILMTSDAGGKRHILCTDNDMNKNWEDMIFRSNFRGITLALDGHRLFYSNVSTNNEYVSR